VSDLRPFRTNREWRHLRDADPAGWARAVAVDEQVRPSFLHRSCVPLVHVDLSESTDGQMTFEDCEEGLCGV